MTMRRRELLTGAAALAAYGALGRSTDAAGPCVGTRRVVCLGGNGGGKGSVQTSSDVFAANISQDTFYSDVAGPFAVSSGGLTYVCWQSVNYDVYIATINEATGVVTGPYLVDFGKLTSDGHGVPAFLIDDGGTFHYMHGCHVSQLFYLKSTSPLNIINWGAQTSPVASCSYPLLFQTADHTIWLWFRNGDHRADQQYQTSTDHGVTWSGATSVISGGFTTGNNEGYYTHVAQGSDDSFHVAFLWKDEAQVLAQPGPEYIHRYNIYYMKRTAGGTWVDSSGTTLGTFPVTLPFVNSNLRIYRTDVAPTFTNIPTLALDGNNVPYMLFLTGRGVGFSSHTYIFGSLVTGSWVFTPITTTDHIFDSYQLSYEGGTTFKAYLIVGGSSGLAGDFELDSIMMGDRGGAVQEWTTTDGGATWAQTATVATVPGSSQNQLWDQLGLPRNAHAAAKLVIPGRVEDPSTFPNTSVLKIYNQSSGLTKFSYEAETIALLNRFAVTPSVRDQWLINSKIRSFKQIGLFPLDGYWDLTLADWQSSSQNWASNNHNLVLVGTPTFTPYVGLTCDNSNYVDTGIALNTLTNYTQNSGHFSNFLGTNTQSNSADSGSFNGTSDLLINARNTSNLGLFRINQNASLSAPFITDSSQLHTVNRTGATAVQYYKNGVSNSTGTNASVARSSSPSLTLGKLNGAAQSSGRTLQTASIGGGVTATMELARYRIELGKQRILKAI